MLFTLLLPSTIHALLIYRGGAYFTPDIPDLLKIVTPATVPEVGVSLLLPAEGKLLPYWFIHALTPKQLQSLSFDPWTKLFESPEYPLPTLADASVATPIVAGEASLDSESTVAKADASIEPAVPEISAIAVEEKEKKKEEEEESERDEFDEKDFMVKSAQVPDEKALTFAATTFSKALHDIKSWPEVADKQFLNEISSMYCLNLGMGHPYALLRIYLVELSEALSKGDKKLFLGIVFNIREWKEIYSYEYQRLTAYN